MAKAKSRTPKPITPVALTPDHAEAFRELKIAEAAQRNYRKLLRRVKRLRRQLSEAFGAAVLGELPDGTLVHRKPQKREYEPLAAKTIEWDEFDETLPWDVT